MDTNKVIRTLNFYYYGVMFAAVLTAVAAFFLLKETQCFIDTTSPLGIHISYGVILYVIISIPITLWWFHKQMQVSKNLQDENAKILKYKKYSAIRTLFIGLGLILGILFFYILQQQSMLYCGGMAAIALFFCKPSEAKMLTELEPTNN